ncbi:hypothetical protein BH24ACT13_BH24ACT13_12700 [soil metagenome]
MASCPAVAFALGGRHSRTTVVDLLNPVPSCDDHLQVTSFSHCLEPVGGALRRHR